MKKQKKTTTKNKSVAPVRRALNFAKFWVCKFWNVGFWHKLTLVVTTFIFVLTLGMYSVAQWYIGKHRSEPLVIGATFIPNYARYFELDPKETLHAMIYELGIRDFRFVSYWSNGEPEPGQYDFAELDWQFDMVEEVGGTVSLAIGLRQPRWPECHMPTWAKDLPKDQWSVELEKYMSETVARYKDRPSLQSYQLENEYLLEAFGDCPDHSRERLVKEFKMVKSLDPDTTLITSRSNNAVPSWPLGEPRSDINAASIYKRVWDGTITKRYFEYPVPAWFYAFLAGGAEITTGRNTFIHELQTEAWTPPDFGGLKDAPIGEQDKSFSASDVEPRLQYAIDTGMKRIDIWGVEWYYYRMTKLDDPSLWNATKSELTRIRQANQN